MIGKYERGDAVPSIEAAKKNSGCLRRVTGLSGRRGGQQLLRQKNCQTPAGHRKTAARGQGTHLRPDGRIPVQVPGTELPQRIKQQKPGSAGLFISILCRQVNFKTRTKSPTTTIRPSMIFEKPCMIISDFWLPFLPSHISLKLITSLPLTLWSTAYTTHFVKAPTNSKKTEPIILSIIFLIFILFLNSLGTSRGCFYRVVNLSRIHIVKRFICPPPDLTSCSI